MIMNKEDIKKIIPHRDPMLLVDTVEAMEKGKSIQTSFYVDPAREIFKGHFPQDPVLLGVYTVECMAQASDILLLSDPDYAGTTPLFIGINNVKFKSKIKPGDTVIVKSVLTMERREKAIATCSAQAWVGETLCAEGDVTLAMR